MIRVSEIAASDLEEREELAELAEEAGQFLLSHPKWCKGIREAYFDRGFSKVAVFFFEIDPAAGADPEVWVIVGDVPPAYMDLLNCPNGAMALDSYLMHQWCEAVKKGESVADQMPVFERGSLVCVEPTIQIAEMLEAG